MDNKQQFSELSPEELLQKGDEFLRQGERHLAYQCYCTLLESDSEHQLAWLRRAQTARGPGERQACLEKLRALEEKQPVYRYENLDILIGLETAEGYEVRVLSSPLGEKRASMRLCPKSSTFQVRLQQLDLDIGDDNVLKELGGLLFNALFTRGVGENIYKQSLEQARKKDRVLRILLRIEPHDLATLPWELLYDEKENEFLSTGLYTRLIRYPQVLQPVRDFEMALPIKLLLLVSNPKDMPALDVEREISLIYQALGDIAQSSSNKSRPLIELEVLTRPTQEAIEASLPKGFHIVHFIGHGTFEEEGPCLVMVEEDETASLMSGREVGELLGACDSIRLVVLNSCKTAKTLMNESFLSVAKDLVNHGVPCVVAMQYSIYDSDALIFSEEFYRTLAEPNYVDMAIHRARRSLMSRSAISRRSWATPVLFMRASDGIIINFMTPYQTESYLSRKGFLNPFEVERIYEITRGHPLLIRLIADLWTHLDENSRQGFVEEQLALYREKHEDETIRFLYNELVARISDERVRKVMTYGPALGLINTDILGKVLEIKDPTDVTTKLRDVSLLAEEEPGELRFPRQIQELQIKEIQTTNPNIFKRLTERMAQYCAQRMQETEQSQEKKKWLAEVIRHQFQHDDRQGIASWLEKVREAEEQGDYVASRELLNEAHVQGIETQLSSVGKAIVYDSEGNYWESRREPGRADGYFRRAQAIGPSQSKRLLTELQNELRKFIVSYKPHLRRLLNKAEIKRQEGRRYMGDLSTSADLRRARQAYESSLQHYRKLGSMISIAGRTLGFFRGNIKLRSDPRFLRGLALTNEMLGVLCHNQAKWRRAMKSYKTALNIYRSVGDQKRCEVMQQFIEYVELKYIPHFIFSESDMDRWPDLDLEWLDRLPPGLA